MGWRRRKRIRTAAILALTFAVVLVPVAIAWHDTPLPVQIQGVNWGPAMNSAGPERSGAGLSTLEYTAGGGYSEGSAVTVSTTLVNSDPHLACLVANVSVSFSEPWNIGSTNAPLTIPPLASATLSATFHCPENPYNGSIEIDYTGTPMALGP